MSFGHVTSRVTWLLTTKPLSSFIPVGLYGYGLRDPVRAVNGPVN